MKKYFFLSLLGWFSSALLPCRAQTIPQYFFGENAWMPDSVGTTKPNGKLHDNWGNVAASNVKLVRVGGKSADRDKYTNHQYIEMVDSIRSRGMEPVLQVSYFNHLYDSIVAHDIVTYVNITNARNVKYWSIGNEPDLYVDDTTAAAISKYIKEYAIAMKKVDSTIRIIGPGIGQMQIDMFTDDYKVIDSLTTWNGSKSIVDTIPNNPSIYGKAAGKCYIDFFSYHMYNYDGTAETKTRDWLITRLTAAAKDSARMGWISRRCNTINANRASQPLKPVMTEANICYYSTGTVTDDNWEGAKGNGFFAGQHWSEAMSLGIYQGIQWINFWSVMESSGLGFMTNDATPTKKSTYWHMKEMGKWLDSTHYIGSDQNISGTPITNIKAFGSKNADYIAVIILNQDTVNTYKRKYAIRLNGSFPATTDSTEITIGMGLDKTYQDTIDASSTTLLVFDLDGNISQKFWYKQSYGSSAPGFQPDSCSADVTFANQALLNNYYSSTYNNITIGNGSNSITLSSTNNTIYRAVNTITINGTFDSGTQTLELLPTECY